MTKKNFFVAFLVLQTTAIIYFFTTVIDNKPFEFRWPPFAGAIFVGGIITFLILRLPGKPIKAGKA